MIIGSIKEENTTENRTPITPQTSLELKKLGHTILLEKSIGQKSYFKDEDYLSSSPKFLSPQEIYQQADIILQINPPSPKFLKILKSQQLLIADFTNTDISKIPLKSTIIRLEKVPRSSIAQEFDILSSQSLVRGYSSALYALSLSPIMAPTLFTPSTSIKQINTLIIGASLTGLEASTILKLNGANTFILDKDHHKEELIKSVEAKFIHFTPNLDITSILQDKNIIISSAYSNNFTPTIITPKHLKKLPTGTTIIDTTIKNIKIPPTHPILSSIIFHRNTKFERLTPKTASTLWAHNMLNLIKILSPTPNTINFNHPSISPMLFTHPTQRRIKCIY